MNRKNFIKLLHPPTWLTILLTVFCTAALIFIFVNGWEEHPISVAAYVLSFYTLCVVTLVCIRVFPKWYRSIKQAVYDNQYGNRYMTDVVFKTHVSLYCSLAINLLYVAVNIISAILNRSMWFIILAGYYIILSLMRFLLLRYYNHNTIGESRIAELRRSRLCAIILLLVNLYLSGGVLMMLYQNRGFNYNGILIYVMAMYTFYITISAILNCVKYRRYQSPVMSTSKVISLAAALVSMLSLETAMISQFGMETSETFRRVMIACTGAGVSIVVVTMSVYMIVKACTEIGKEKRKQKSQAQ